MTNIEDIDKIDWSSLDHYQGKAVDVPDLLKTIMTETNTSRDRANAILRLHNLVVEDGDITNVVPYIVSYLVSTLDSSDQELKVQVLEFLVKISTACYSCQEYDREAYPDSLWEVVMAQMKYSTVDYEMLCEEFKKGLDVFERLTRSSSVEIRKKGYVLLTRLQCRTNELADKLLMWYAEAKDAREKFVLLFCLAIGAPMDSIRTRTILEQVVSDRNAEKLLRLAAGFSLIGAFRLFEDKLALGRFEEVLLSHPKIVGKVGQYITDEFYILVVVSPYVYVLDWLQLLPYEQRGEVIMILQSMGKRLTQYEWQYLCLRNLMSEKREVPRGTYWSSLEIK